MEKQYFREYSPVLEREMEWKVYGRRGRPVLFIPCQDGRFFDFEDFGMAAAWSPWISSGQVMVFAIDTLDKETWSNKGGDPYWRIRRHEQWVRYITDEMVPKIREMACRRNGWEEAPGVLTFGCSLGATHAVNLYFRRPDLFSGTLALSGIYTADYGFDGYMDDLVYLNSPVHYMENLPEDHPYIPVFNSQRAVICVGQGPWEQPATTYQLADILRRKDIHTWVDFWGHDCAHDWPWWFQQVTYFLPWLLGNRD